MVFSTQPGFVLLMKTQTRLFHSKSVKESKVMKEIQSVYILLFITFLKMVTFA